MAIRVESAYSDGYESVRVQDVEVAPFGDIDQLWEHLEEYTGDGHGTAGKLGYCYTITVLECPERPEVIGQSNEWAGV